MNLELEVEGMNCDVPLDLGINSVSCHEFQKLKNHASDEKG